MNRCAVGALALTSAAWFSVAATADPCDPWTLHGYHVGQSRASAEVLRPMAARKDGTFRVRERGRFDGTLRLDAEGTVAAYNAMLKTPGVAENGAWTELVDALRSTLGEPVAEANEPREDGNLLIWTVRWRSPIECGGGTEIRADRVKSNYPGGSQVSFVMVWLESQAIANGHEEQRRRWATELLK